MSDILSINWDALNSTRKYPLDELASGILDSGKFASSYVISDAQLITASTSDVYVMSYAVTPDLVTIVIGVGSGSVTDAAGIVVCDRADGVVPTMVEPLGSAKLIAGWVTPGVVTIDGSVTSEYGSFSSPAQSKLTEECVVRHSSVAVNSVKTSNSAMFTGDVLLQVSGPLMISRDGSDIFIEMPTDADTLATYAGSSRGDPTSLTCRRQPITSINGVGPDINGNVNIKFEGFNVNSAGSGVCLASAIETTDYCRSKSNLANENGELPDVSTCDARLNPIDLTKGEALSAALIPADEDKWYLVGETWTGSSGTSISIPPILINGDCTMSFTCSSQDGSVSVSCGGESVDAVLNTEEDNKFGTSVGVTVTVSGGVASISLGGVLIKSKYDNTDAEPASSISASGTTMSGSFSVSTGVSGTISGFTARML